MPVNITGPFGQTLTAQTMLDRNAQLSVSVADGGSFSFRYFFSENEIKPMVGAATGMSIVLGVAQSFGVSVGSASGVAAAVAIAASLRSAEGVVAGAASATGLGAAVRTSIGSAGGASSVTGVTLSSGASVGQAVGVATISGVALALGEAPGVATGQSAVSGVGASVSIAEASGNSAGQSAVSGTAVSVKEAAGSAAGAATVSGVTTAAAPDLILVSFDDETDTVTLTADQDGDLDWALVSGATWTYSSGVFSGADVRESGDAGTYTVAGGTQDFSPAYTNAADGANTLVIGITNANGDDTVQTAFIPIITREMVGSSAGVAAVSGVGSSSLVASGAGSSAGVATVSGVGADAGSSGITPTYVNTAQGASGYTESPEVLNGLLPDADTFVVFVAGQNFLGTLQFTVQGTNISSATLIEEQYGGGAYIGAWLVTTSAASTFEIIPPAGGSPIDHRAFSYRVTGAVSTAFNGAGGEAAETAVSLASVPVGAAIVACSVNCDLIDPATTDCVWTDELASGEDAIGTAAGGRAASVASLANGTLQTVSSTPAFDNPNPGAPWASLMVQITDS